MPLRGTIGHWRAERKLRHLLLGAAALVAMAGAAAARDLPRSEAELVERVRTALLERDVATFDELINWEGAGAIKRRVVGFQVRHGFGRPIRSVAVEPFPADGFRAIEERGTLKPNMPVSRQVRVVFDEPDNPYGRPPTAVFLVGKEDEAYRIALVVPTKKPGQDRR
jgi:hypothetical protein